MAEHALALTRVGEEIVKFAVVFDGSVIGRVDLNPPPRPLVGM